VKDCQRFISLCDIYLSVRDIRDIQTKCENKTVSDILAKRTQDMEAKLQHDKDNLVKTAQDMEIKNQDDREFIIETVDNMNIADILIKRFAPLTDIAEKKAQKLRSMHAAMRAINLVKDNVEWCDIFDMDDLTEVGTTSEIFIKNLMADKKVMKKVSSKDEDVIKKSRRNFIGEVARNALITYSLVDYFEPVDKDDADYTDFMTAEYNVRKRAAIAAIEFAGGRKVEVFPSDKDEYSKSKLGEQRLKEINEKKKPAPKLPNSNKKPRKESTNTAAAVEEPAMDDVDVNIAQAPQGYFNFFLGRNA
jgi:hypothetical protein